MSAVVDIYTTRPIDEESSEHIIHHALGGRLESKDLIAKRTNDVFGHTIDAALINFVALIRTLLNTPSASGSSPPAVQRSPIMLSYPPVGSQHAESILARLCS